MEKTVSVKGYEFKVNFDYQPPERQTRHYPGCNESVYINIIWDSDGDELSYLWTVAGVPVLDQGSPSVRLMLPLNDNKSYAVQVQVSDGEEVVMQNWTVRPEPPDRPDVSPDDSPWFTAGATALALLVLLGVAAYSVHHVWARLRQGDG